MIGDKYWSTGITVWCLGDDRWQAEIEFMDNGWCDHRSTQGKLSTRYIGDLAQAIDVLKADYELLGGVWYNTLGETIYYKGDGEWKDFVPPPDWRERLAAECKRIGWRSIYEEIDQRKEAKRCLQLAEVHDV